jgi:antitoxin ParD1/3/4
MNVSLTPKLDGFVGEQVESGRYRSASEVVREGLRLLELRQMQIESIQQALDEGLASKPIAGRESMGRIRQNLKERHGI